MESNSIVARSHKYQTPKSKVQALFYTLLHPFDGFYECKHHGLKSMPLAILGLVLFGFMACLKYQYAGFVVNTNAIHFMNSLRIFVSATSIFILFAVANWTITTLFNGKGFLGDIIMVIGYALYPVILGDIIYLIGSNFVIQEEVILLLAVSGISWVWFAFLALAGLTTIHEYGFGRTIVTILASFISMIIIIFILILYVTLMQQLISFISSLLKELIRRA